MKLNIDLNEANILGKLTNPKLGLFISNEWKRLIDPYTPRDTGVLMGITGQTVDLKPFEIHYKAPYSEKVYYGYDMTFKKNNPYSTYEWDIAAAKAGQKDKLIRSTNNALKSGKI